MLVLRILKFLRSVGKPSIVGGMITAAVTAGWFSFDLFGAVFGRVVATAFHATEGMSSYVRTFNRKSIGLVPNF